MRHLRRQATHQRGAQVVEYALLIAVVSLSLVLALPALGSGLCQVNNRVGVLFGATASTCAEGNNGGGNNTGSGNNGGSNNSGGGTNPGNGNGNGKGKG
jgi:Flp pilus assembly pilin Flp